LSILQGTALPSIKLAFMDTAGHSAIAQVLC
jgi:hypothetical protein